MNTIHDAIERVRIEATHHCGLKDPPDPRWVCLAAMNYVRWNMSPAVYGHLARTGNPLPKTTEACLAAGAGICGHQAQGFIDLIAAFGIPGRLVTFEYVHSNGAAEGHVAAEAYYRDDWHFFGTTWGVVFEKGEQILGLEEIRALDDPMSHIIYDRVYVDYSSCAVAGLDPLCYIRSLVR